MNEVDADPSELRALHDEVVIGTDPTAPARLAELLIPALRRRFSRSKLPDPHEVDSLIGLSIAKYLRDPDKWDPDRGPLLAFLWRDVDGDIKNELDKLRRQRRSGHPDSRSVELGAVDRNLNVEENVLDEMDPYDMEPSRVKRAQAALATFDERDQRMIELLGAGVRSTGPYAEILGIAHLPEAIQAKEVKRHKDRLNKRIETIRGRVN